MKVKLNSAAVGFGIAYVIALAMMLSYNLTHPLVNDGVYEYQAYLANIQEGWHARYTLVNAALFTTWIPALLHNWFGGDALILFRVWPPLFYALLPAFTYLIAKRYLSTTYAWVAVIVVILNSYILYFPDVGRVGVAVAFLAGMVWALLSRRMVFVVLFAILIVMAHYGTSLIAVGFLAAITAVLGLFALRNHNLRSMKYYLVALGVLVIAVGVWNFGIAKYSGQVMSDTLFQQSLTGYSLPQYSIVGDGSDKPALIGKEFFDASTREPAVQSAINITNLPMPNKIEVMANWLLVAMISLGLLFVVKNKGIEPPLKVMTVVFYGLIIFTVAIPWLSVYYGGMRVLFTGAMVLSVCFVDGIRQASKWVRVHPLILSALVLIPYGLSTSGLIYLPFGMVKSFPVVIMVVQ